MLTPSGRSSTSWSPTTTSRCIPTRPTVGSHPTAARLRCPIRSSCSPTSARARRPCCSAPPSWSRRCTALRCSPKRTSTVALLTDGRLRLGLGIGWQREEYAAVGVPYADRGRRLEECIDAMRALWAGPSASYEGKYWSFSKVSCNPRPREGTVPIVLGGNTDPAVPTRWTGRRRVVPVHDLARRLRDPNRAPADGCTRRRSRSVVGRDHGLAGQLRPERRSRPRVGAPVRGGGGRSPGVRVATVRKRRPRTAARRHRSAIATK